MSEISHFLKQGWKNLWRVKHVWLFAFLASFGSIGGIFGILFTIAGTTGVIYIASRATLGESVTLGEALRAVGKYFLRVTTFYLLLGVVLLIVLVVPCYSSIRFLTMSSETAQLLWMLPGRMIPITFLTGIFSAFYFLPLIDMVANGSGIGKSIGSSTALITRHPGLWLRIGFLFGLLLAVVHFFYWMMFIPWSSIGLTTVGSLSLQKLIVQPANILWVWLLSMVDQCLYAYFTYVFALAFGLKENPPLLNPQLGAMTQP